MKWCRIVEAEGLHFLLAVAPTESGEWGMVCTWYEDDSQRNTFLSPDEFRGLDDVLEFMHALSVKNVLAMRQSLIEACGEQIAADAAQDVIERIKGMH